MDDDYYDRRREMQYDAYDDRMIVTADELFHDLLIDANMSVDDLEAVINKLHEMGVSDNEIGRVLDENLDHVLSWFEDCIDESSASAAVYFIKTMDEMYALRNKDVANKVKAAITPHKHKFIEGFLIEIKRGTQDTDLIRTIRGIVEWPELDIMLRSLIVGRLAESNLRINQQNAVDTWYRRLYNDLEQEYHDMLAWCLIMMGGADAQLSQPPYKTFFNRHKDTLLKSILTVVANMDDQITYSDREVRDMMLGVRKLGLDWPEIDVIERSLRSDKIIKESDGAVDRQIEYMSYKLSRLTDDPYADVSPMVQVSIFLRLVKEGEINAKDVASGLDTIKDKILRYMLVQIRRGKIKTYNVDIPLYIRELKELGVIWKELEIIERSISLEKANTDD